MDFLILDLPPGTGDIQLTIVQTAELDGVVVVTTPQEVALIDARKDIGLFERVETPIPVSYTQLLCKTLHLPSYVYATISLFTISLHPVLPGLSHS